MFFYQYRKEWSANTNLYYSNDLTSKLEDEACSWSLQVQPWRGSLELAWVPSHHKIDKCRLKKASRLCYHHNNNLILYCFFINTEKSNQQIQICTSNDLTSKPEDEACSWSLQVQTCSWSLQSAWVSSHHKIDNCRLKKASRLCFQLSIVTITWYCIVFLSIQKSLISKYKSVL